MTRILFLAIITLAFLLRISFLTTVPPALHGDELGTGYNAYLLLKTGRDEYQKKLPLTFRNDFSPLIFYATIPFIATFGLSENAVRLPSVIIGVLTIFYVYFLCNQLFKSKKVSLLVIYLLAFSTWHLRSSRLGLEMIWALFFQLMGLVFFFKKSKSFNRSLIISFVSFGLSIFSYQSAKLTTPLLVIGLLVIYRNKLIKKRIKFLAFLFLLFIILPLIIYPFVRPIHQWRIAGISILTKWKSTLPKETSLFSFSAISTLGHLVIINYLKHFYPRLLFLDNSRLRYFQLSGFGLYYHWQFIFILIGLAVTLLHRKKPENRLLLWWIFLSPLPASLTTGVPNANIGRNLMMLPTLEILTARGFFQINKLLPQRSFKQISQVYKLTMVPVIALSAGIFLHQYLVSEPKKSTLFWGKPYKQAMLIIKPLETKLNKIIITNDNPQSYIYMLFYLKKPPQWLFGQPKKRAKIVGYAKIGKFEFKPINNKVIETSTDTAHNLLIGTAREISQNNKNIIKEIKGGLNDEAVYLRIMTSRKQPGN